MYINKITKTVQSNRMGGDYIEVPGEFRGIVMKYSPHLDIDYDKVGNIENMTIASTWREPDPIEPDPTPGMPEGQEELNDFARGLIDGSGYRKGE